MSADKKIREENNYLYLIEERVIRPLFGKSDIYKSILIVGLPVLLFFTSLMIGRYDVEPVTTLKILLSSVPFIPIQET